MKLYLSVDMEGLWGVSSPEQITPGGREYQRGRTLMTQEVNLVIDLLYSHGVETILINDSHGTMDNILIEELDQRVSLISGNDKPLGMMEGIDESFDAALFIGYHPRAMSEKGIFDHTYSGKLIQDVTVKGQSLGESGLNARLAGAYDVPVIFISGDDTLCEQVNEEIGDIETLAVKRTISRYCAEHCSKDTLEADYREKISNAIRRLQTIQPVKVEGPVNAEVAFKESVMTEGVLLHRGIERMSPNRVMFESKDYEAFYKTFRALIGLAR